MSSASSVSGINSLQYAWQPASQSAGQPNGIDPETIQQEAVQGTHGGHHRGGGVGQSARNGTPSASASDAKARGANNATASQQTANQQIADLRRALSPDSDDETNGAMDSDDGGGDSQEDQLASEINSDAEEDADGSHSGLAGGRLFDATV